MAEIIAYLLKSFLVSGTLLAYYWLFLRNKKLNSYNRYYLLLALLTSIVLPLIHFRIHNIFPSEDNISIGFGHLIKSNKQLAESPEFPWQVVFFAAALVTSCILVLVFLAQIARLLTLSRRFNHTRVSGANIIITDLREAPFSFVNNLFWKKGIDMATEEGKLIFEHEMVHIREGHSYDKLFAQLVARIFWMNPFYILMSRELSIVHEFRADEKAIVGGDTMMFAKMLLTSHNEGKYLSLEHSFFHSPIKRRLTMVAISNKTSLSFLRRICALPLALALLFFFSVSSTQAQGDSSKMEDSERLKKIESEQKANPFNQMEPQGHTPSEAEVKELFAKIVTNPPADRVYFINNSRVSIEKVKRLKYKNTKDMLLLPPEDALKKFGVTGEKGVIAFLTKK